MISNFNADPMPLTRYCKDYLILDQSNDPEVISKLKSLTNPHITFASHVGHNLIDYLDFIINNYGDLPQRIAFLKGNVIGRHIDENYWMRVYRNHFYTFIFGDPNLQDKTNIAYSTQPGDFLEINNSWYVSASTHRYFTNYNQLLSFIYKVDKFPHFLNFSPGACYIVERERILRHPVTLYVGLRKILLYGFFPSEAWMVERMMHTIWSSNYELQDYVYNEEDFLAQIALLPDRTEEKLPQRSRIKTFRLKVYWKIRKLLGPILKGFAN